MITYFFVRKMILIQEECGLNLDLQMTEKIFILNDKQDFKKLKDLY